MEYYTAFKKNEILWYMTAQMHLEDIMLKGINQSQKGKYYMLPLTWDTWNSQIHRIKKWNGGCGGLGGVEMGY